MAQKTLKPLQVLLFHKKKNVVNVYYDTFQALHKVVHQSLEDFRSRADTIGQMGIMKESFACVYHYQFFDAHPRGLVDMPG